ncbi:MAG: proline dehydrogenase family protein, partial [Actinomycetota bacterium]|nr:proline dehydrogenase family protein [Actinomycetota bacterium]
MGAPSEAEVQALARRIAEAGASEKSRIFRGAWWSEQLLEWAMAHPGFKTQLFRFVDVFPACRDDEDVMRHLEEYLGGGETPAPLQLGLGLAGWVPFGAGVSAATARRNITRLARQFIAGETASQALPRLRTLWEAGEAATVDLLGEKTITSAEADRYADRVATVLETLATASAAWPRRPRLESDPWGDLPRVNISIKATALAPRFAPLTRAEGIEEALARLRPVLLRARQVPATIHIDTEHDDVKDVTFDLVRAIGAEFPGGPALGCVVQAYRKDSFADLRDLVAWSGGSLTTPLQIRLVKGAYWDFETVVARAEGWPIPVFERKAETDANYERCARYLVEHAGKVRPAFASHNLRSLAYGLAASRAAGLPEGAVELQLLYGMAEPVHAALRRLGERVRVYAPVGELVPGMAYLVRRLLENTSNESFLRHRFAEGRALTELLKPPDVPGVRGAPDALDRALPEAEGDPPSRPPTDPAHPAPFFNEPPAELRRAGPRARLTAAVTKVGGELGFEAPVVVDGRPRPTRNSIVSVDPGDYDTVVCTSGRAGGAEVEAALTAAQRAVPDWRRAGWQHRAGVLFRAADLMRHRRAQLAALMVFEAGKPIREADADVAEAIDFCEYYGREALRLGAGVSNLQAPGESNSYRYQPRGIGVVIAPWNFPLAIPTGMVVAGLVTGNAVLFKPAEQTPGIAYHLVQILLEAGVPPGVLAFLPGVGRRWGPSWSPLPRCRSSPSPARCRWACRSSSGPPCTTPARATSNGWWPRWAARTPSWSTPTPTWTRPCPPSWPAPSGTPARSARPRPGSSAWGPCSTSWWTDSWGRSSWSDSAIPGSCAPRWARSSTRTPGSVCAATRRPPRWRGRYCSSAATSPRAAGTWDRRWWSPTSPAARWPPRRSSGPSWCACGPAGSRRPSPWPAPPTTPSPA